MSSFPVEVGDLIATNYMSPHRVYDYRVVRITHCWPGGCNHDINGPHYHFTCVAEFHPGVQQRHYHSGEFYLNVFRYVGGRLIGHRQQPGTAGWTKAHETNGGYDEIILIRKARREEEGVVIRHGQAQTEMALV